jgi:hypothetical protein
MEEAKEEVKEEVQVKEEVVVEIKESLVLAEETKNDINLGNEEVNDPESVEVVSEEIATAKKLNKLQGKWTIWVSKNSKKVTEGNYESSLEKIGTFETIPEFWAYVSLQLFFLLQLNSKTFYLL